MARPNATARGYGKRWQAARAGFLRSHPRCAWCLATATVVHHRTPHRGCQQLFWDRRNWEPLCQPCHDGPAQREDRRGYGTAVDDGGQPTDARHPWNS